MDLCAYGVVCNDADREYDGPNGYTPLLRSYINSEAYSKVDGNPLISTYSSGGQTRDQIAAWKRTIGPMYFVPDFDETQGYYDAADGWWAYWGEVVDGLFSWEAAWPSFGGFGGKFPGDISPDVTVMNGARAHNKAYMIGVSPLQYKNAYGTNVYRPGGTSMPRRLAAILALPNPPEFVQVVSWNDGPESHYIGNVWPEANPQVAMTAYSVYDHTGWQHLIQHFIQSYKYGTLPTAFAPGVMWYQTTLQSSTCPHDTKPANFADGDDFVHWATFLPPSAGTCQVKIMTASTVLGVHTVGAGASFGGTTCATPAGVPTMEILDPTGKVLAVASGGKPVSDGHPQGIYDMNYQVVAAKAVDE